MTFTDDFWVGTGPKAFKRSSVLVDIAVNVKDYGAKGDGVTDDTAAFQAARDKVINGGILYIPKPSVAYLISDDIGFSSGTGLVIILGDNAKFTRKATTNSYDMFSYRDNMIIIGVELEGYVQSGTGYADVIPNWSFGFRSRAGIKNVEFINCTAHKLPFDGWYHDVANSNLKLTNCRGYNCYRNDFAAVNGNVIEIDGGEWGKDTISISGKVNSIDIEPDSGNKVKKTIIKNLQCNDILNFFGGSGIIENVEVDNITLDGANAGLSWFRIQDMRLGDVQYLNGAALVRANTGTPGIGRFTSKQIPTGKNLLVNPYNSVTGWTLYNSGGSVELNKKVGDKKGVRTTAAAGNIINYRQTISVTEGKTYSFGGLIEAAITASSDMGIFLVVGANTYYLQAAAGEIKKVAAAIKIPTGVTSVTFYFGSNNTFAHDMVFTDLFLIEGIVGEYHVEPDPFMSAAPTVGTWEAGQVVWNSAPAASGFIGWVCVTAGTPGTWKGFGAIQT